MGAEIGSDVLAGIFKGQRAGEEETYKRTQVEHQQAIHDMATMIEIHGNDVVNMPEFRSLYTKAFKAQYPMVSRTRKEQITPETTEQVQVPGTPPIAEPGRATTPLEATTAQPTVTQVTRPATYRDVTEQVPTPLGGKFTDPTLGELMPGVRGDLANIRLSSAKALGMKWSDVMGRPDLNYEQVRGQMLSKIMNGELDPNNPAVQLAFGLDKSPINDAYRALMQAGSMEALQQQNPGAYSILQYTKAQHQKTAQETSLEAYSAAGGDMSKLDTAQRAFVENFFHQGLLGMRFSDLKQGVEMGVLSPAEVGKIYGPQAQSVAESWQVTARGGTSPARASEQEMKRLQTQLEHAQADVNKAYRNYIGWIQEQAAQGLLGEQGGVTAPHSYLKDATYIDLKNKLEQASHIRNGINLKLQDAIHNTIHTSVTREWYPAGHGSLVGASELKMSPQGFPISYADGRPIRDGSRWQQPNTNQVFEWKNGQPVPVP
jgi:hypothetical protein